MCLPLKYNIFIQYLLNKIFNINLLILRINLLIQYIAWEDEMFESYIKKNIFDHELSMGEI